jgi:hypothetical protein
MAVEYPDIIGEYLAATERYEASGVQIVPHLEPAEFALGEVANLVLFLQSALDVPVELSLKADLPKTSRFRGSPLLALGSQELKVALEPGQVGSLFIPVTTTSQGKEGQHQLHLNVSGQAQGRATRIRPQRATSRFRSDLIDDLVGLDLVHVLGTPYRVTPTQKISVTLKVRGQAESAGEAADLATRFQPLWSLEDFERQGEALQEVSQRRAVIIDQLQTEPVFVALFVEGQRRFADAGAPLRIGEAIALGKVLTYTVRYFLADGNLQDGLLVPMWELANHFDLPTGDPLWVLRNVGFRHLMRLAVALSFGVVRQALGRHPWVAEERRAVISLIGEAVEAGQALPPEFIYIPLLMAAPAASQQIVLEGEDSRHSLRLLQKAKAARARIFDDPELMEANVLFDRLLSAALQRQM